ncbi:MAG TPA: hypothetical protein VGN63_12725 [Flavisolibacter sp.]|jgi:hypothetical protein|nr:hypothetical protein [Flavisolibacter sp.]
MTQIAIQTQVDAIKRVAQDVLKSKEATLQFLIDAGIIRESKTAHHEHVPTAPTRSESSRKKKKD